MKSRIPYYPQSLFLLGVVLVIVAAVAMRVAKQSWVENTLPDTTQTATSSVPDFTSATFTTGDALASVGPEWTFVRQTPEEQSASAPAGTVSKRESVIQSVEHSSLTLLLEEGSIRDRNALNAFLDERVKAKSYTKTTIAGREGYLVTVADIMNSKALLLIGDRTYLLIKRSAAEWPTELEPEVSSYIGSVRVP